jgi:hypothetical protein
MTTPTLLEQCGMCGSCCIDARVEMVLRLTPPNDPVEERGKSELKSNAQLVELGRVVLTSRRVQRRHLIITFGEAPGNGEFYN